MPPAEADKSRESDSVLRCLPRFFSEQMWSRTQEALAVLFRQDPLLCKGPAGPMIAQLSRDLRLSLVEVDIQVNLLASELSVG